MQRSHSLVAKTSVGKRRDGQSRAEIAAQLGMTENAVRQALRRFRQRYQVLLREEIAHTVAIASDIEDELRHLISVLRA